MKEIQTSATISKKMHTGWEKDSRNPLTISLGKYK